MHHIAKQESGIWGASTQTDCFCRGVHFPQTKGRAGTNEKPNRTGRTKPRTEPFNSGNGRNSTRNRTEPNRTEPRRVRKTQDEARRAGNFNFPNRTEPINFEKSGTEPNRFLPGCLHISWHGIPDRVDSYCVGWSCSPMCFICMYGLQTYLGSEVVCTSK